MSAAAAWDALHRDPRHRLEYPSEHVVRWLAGLGYAPTRLYASALDIGCGDGRHVQLLERLGYRAMGCDVSQHAVRATELRVEGALAAQGATTALPFADECIDVALAYGVFYYGTRDEHRQAIAEMRRVMRAGGRGFVCIRTDNDWRQRFTFNGVFHCHGEPEDGMPMHFLTEYEVRTMYGAFSDVRLELTETTRRGRTRCDSDWLIEVQK